MQTEWYQCSAQVDQSLPRSFGGLRRESLPQCGMGGIVEGANHSCDVYKAESVSPGVHVNGLAGSPS